MSSSGQRNDWWWIWDDPSLSVYEKAVAQAVHRSRYRGHAVVLDRNKLIWMTSTSRATVIRAENSLVKKGCLRISPTGRKDSFLYELARFQGELFDSRDVASVQNAVDNNCITARPEGSGSDTVSNRDGPISTVSDRYDLLHRTSLHTKATTAHECARIPSPYLQNEKAAAEHARRQEAKDLRLTMEEKGIERQRLTSGEQRREDYRKWAVGRDEDIAAQRSSGSAPSVEGEKKEDPHSDAVALPGELFDELRKTLRIVNRPNGRGPMTEAEASARLQELRRQARELAEVAAPKRAEAETAAAADSAR